MAFKDILLPFASYPDKVDTPTLEQTVRLCALLGDAACAVTNHVRIPLKSNVLADVLIGLTDMARQEEQRSLDQARDVLSQFQKLAAEAQLAATEVMLRSELYDVTDRIAAAARTRDLCIVSVKHGDAAARALAEAVIFGSGRPVVVFQSVTPAKLDRVAIAWDGGRPAARAVADALPILKAASAVEILTVLNEKPSANKGQGEELRRHLGRHGVAAEIREIDAEDHHIGVVLTRRLQENPVDLLVMGAFGHARIREFILGGATQSLLGDAPAPVFFSH